MTKKICIIGGEDVHKRILLSNYLMDAGFQVTIIGTSNQVFPDSITYVPYNLNRSFSPISDYKTLSWLKHFFKNNSFDLIHTFDTKPAFLVPLSQLKTNTPITRTVTGLGTIFMSNSFSSAILRKVYLFLHILVKKRITNTIFQNEDDKNLYLKYNLISNSNYSIILSSGIELDLITQKAKRNNQTFTFICVARLVYEKGIVNLLEAARICSNKGYNFKYLLVGPLEENSKRLNKTVLSQYEDIVDILGSRNDILNLLENSDAFVLPTFREGFSRVLLEAAAVGLPIISTNVTGVRDFTRHNQEAILIEPQDSESLADAMIEIATNKELADKLAKNALIHVKLFSLENVSKQYITIFNTAINHN
ncbi:glycosyltransferase family 4 protein [Bizionia arctica]|uniref:Glycosyl transferase family 1 n=1 Tax=Bizionia arctica TaxID=1495645 RepID=A0A917GJW3_9FLAO|nr:glycosyltransferase family 4 protein [Bizionia arctica]GGG48486.1 glycosyl transferase family 1 [Bizionia arctica]